MPRFEDSLTNQAVHSQYTFIGQVTPNLQITQKHYLRGNVQYSYSWTYVMYKLYTRIRHNQHRYGVSIRLNFKPGHSAGSVGFHRASWTLFYLGLVISQTRVSSVCTRTPKPGPGYISDPQTLTLKIMGTRIGQLQTPLWKV